jgi:tetratricopeptide (TPR) repeat protein
MNAAQELQAALTHHQAGRLSEAEAHYRRALQQDRFNAGILHNLGLVIAARGNFAEAATLIGQAIAVRGNVADFHSNLGNVLTALDRTDEAVASYERALKLNPRFADAAFNLGIALAKLGRIADAESWYRRATTFNPSFWPARLNLANLLDDQGKLDEALPWYEQAASLAPREAAPLYNLARALHHQGRSDAAEPIYRRSLALDATHAETHLTYSLCLLARGALAEGWPEWDWRLRIADAKPRRFAVPEWRGENLTGRRLLVSADQAVGDQILYASMIPELTALAGHVSVECETRLVPLFRRSFPGVEICAHTEPPSVPGRFDYEISIGSLGRQLRPDFASFTRAPSPYLKADAAQVAAIRARYARLGAGPKIGVSWRSRAELGAAKSTDLMAWAPILRACAAQFIDLQYGDTAAERDAIARETGVTVHRDPDIDQMRDLDAFAAQVAALDLVISVSNTTVHVAGALGTPCWIMVPHGKGMHWYWFNDRDDSPWYRSLRLFRQDARGDWRAVIARIGAALADHDFKRSESDS